MPGFVRSPLEGLWAPAPRRSWHALLPTQDTHGRSPSWGSTSILPKRPRPRGWRAIEQRWHANVLLNFSHPQSPHLAQKASFICLTVRRMLHCMGPDSELRAELERLRRRVAEVEDRLPDREATVSDRGYERQMLQAAESVARLGTFVWHEKTREIVWSNGLLDILRLDRTTTPGEEGVALLIAPGDRKRILRLVKLALRGAPVRPTEFQAIRGDGSTVQLLGTATAVRDASGPYVAATCRSARRPSRRGRRSGGASPGRGPRPRPGSPPPPAASPPRRSVCRTDGRAPPA
jgi:PAS domain-containing protein